MVVCHGLLTINRLGCRGIAGPRATVRRNTDCQLLGRHRCARARTKNARAAPRGLHKTTDPLPRRHQPTNKAMGPAGATHDDEPAARLPRRFGSIDGHGQDRERGRDADENRAQVPQGSKVL